MTMLRPHKITFYAYIENEDDGKELQDALNNFVREKYNQGIIITAKKLSNALSKFGNNFFVANYLK